MIMSDQEHAAFLRGFGLAQPPGPEELDAIDRAAEFAPPGPGQLHVAVSKDLAKAFAAEVEPLPENLAAAAWTGFLRGLAAKAGAAPGAQRGCAVPSSSRTGSRAIWRRTAPTGPSGATVTPSTSITIPPALPVSRVRPSWVGT